MSDNSSEEDTCIIFSEEELTTHALQAPLWREGSMKGGASLKVYSGRLEWGCEVRTRMDVTDNLRHPG